jgi:antitoxin YefM
MATESLRNVRDHFSEWVDRVERERERVVVTRNGRPAAVLISPEDLESMEETLAILSDPEVMRGIQEGRDAIRRGDVVRGVEVIRALRPPKK